MGEVWRARDTKLGREVAIKVLPPGFAADAERVARFRREAQILASLNHPRIAAIYGLEEADGALALVMELVAGEDALRAAGARAACPSTKRSRSRGRSPRRSRQRTSKGIVHRDLKPANIKLTPGRQGEGPRLRPREGVRRRGRTAASRATSSRSPTMTWAGTQRRHDPRHRGLHEPRAGARQAGGQARGHLVVRRRPLRDADGSSASSRARPSATPSPRSCEPTRSGRSFRRQRPPRSPTSSAAASSATRTGGFTTSRTPAS